MRRLLSLSTMLAIGAGCANVSVSVDATVARDGGADASADALELDAATFDAGAGATDAEPIDAGPWTCSPTVPYAPGLRVVAELQAWWTNGTSGSHWSGVHYASDDPAVVQAQQRRASDLGIHGFVINWYGEGTISDRALQAHLAEAALHPERDFVLAVMYDGGALSSVLGMPDSAFTALATTQFRYLTTHYTTSAQYLRWGTRPLIQVFRKADTTTHVDWNAVVDAIGGPGLYELQTDGANVVPPFTGGFAWVGPDSVDVRGVWQGSGTARLDSFYAAMTAHPTWSFMGGMWNWFDDTRASWGTNCTLADGTTVRCRVIRPAAGATWCDTWMHNVAHHPSVVQIETWDDYEEGTAIESGIDFTGTLPPAWVP